MFAVLSPRIAVSIVFLVNGLAYGSWVGRVPALANQIGANEGVLGLTLLGTTAGLTLGAPLGGRLCARFGARTVTAAAALGACCLLPTLSLTTHPAQLAAVLFVQGFVVGCLDVAMNVAAVAVVNQLGRPIMPTFHAAFSVGGMAGSGGAALAVLLGWGTGRHFATAAGLGLLAVLVVARHLPGERSERTTGQRHDGVPPVRQPVLWLLAIVAFCSAIGEGAAANWSALFLVQRGAGESVAAIGYAVFSVAMVLTRLGGERVERRFGEHGLLVISGLLGACGFLLAFAVPWAAAGFLGLALAGIGLACVFPVALGVTGRFGEHAGAGGEREIGFVTTIAYLGFLAGPPAVGALAQATSLPVAFGAVGLVVALIMPASRMAGRPRGRVGDVSPNSQD